MRLLTNLKEIVKKLNIDGGKKLQIHYNILCDHQNIIRC